MEQVAYDQANTGKMVPTMNRQIIALQREIESALVIFSSTFFKWLIAIFILIPGWVQAQTSTDWGVVSSDGSYTYYFSGSDITKSFTDTYSFSLEGTGETQYRMNIVYDSCTHGCGNLALDYGIYDGGTLIDDTGSTVLSSGAYEFKVSGTGMGSGNNLTYSGSITFTAMVSPVPEPSETALFILSASLLAWSLSRQRRSRQLVHA